MLIKIYLFFKKIAYTLGYNLTINKNVIGNLHLHNIEQLFPETKDLHLSLQYNKGKIVYLLIPHLSEIKNIYAGLRMIITLGYEIHKKGIPIKFIVSQEILKSKKNDCIKNIKTFYPDFSIKIEDIVSSDEEIHYNPNSLFIASAWWTIYNIRDVDFENTNVFYLIQDYEPCFYPWGTKFALANETYNKNVIPIFSTSYLKDFFETFTNFRFKESSVYHLFIDKSKIYPFQARNSKRKLIFYGRPFVDRNLFDLGLLALNGFIQENEKELAGWEFYSAGQEHSDITLFKNFKLKSIGKLSYKDYADLLRESDIGFSLMYSPHPSYPPYEMAGCGMVVVTNSIYGKDLSWDSKNIISVATTLEAIGAGLNEALQRVDHYEDRIQNSRINLPDTLEECFAEPLELITKKFQDQKS